MRLLFCSRPAYGHLYPLMPLAFAARDAGHDVGFATGGRFVTMLRSLGFPTVVTGIAFEDARAELLAAEGREASAAMREDGRPDIAFGARLFFDVLASRSAADLAPLLDDLAPDLVVYEQGEVGAAVAAGAAGIPTACHAISPRWAIAAVAPLAREHLARLWARFGIDPPPFEVLDGDVYLDIVPPSLQDPSFLDHPLRLAMRPIPWSEPGAALEARPRTRARPLVYATLGTVVGTVDNLAPAIAALSRLDVDVLVALGSATGGTLGDLPDNVQVEAFVDQAAVLPLADLVVHHGGTGTTIAALANARRQLLLPKGADQFFNADVLKARGMATVIEPDAATADAIEAAARAALTAPVPPAAIAAREEIRAMPQPREVLGHVLDRMRVSALQD